MFSKLLIANRGKSPAGSSAPQGGWVSGPSPYIPTWTSTRCMSNWPTRRCISVRRRRRKAISIRRRSSRQRNRQARKRCIRATASCRKIPISWQQSKRPGSSSSARRRTAIRAMGLKDAAKRLMEKAGVPVVPGYHGEAQEVVVLGRQGQRDRLSGADQGACRRRRQGHAQGRRARPTSRMRWRRRSARRNPLSATTACWWKNSSPRRAISRCRCSATVTAMSYICSSAIARCSAVTRR